MGVSRGGLWVQEAEKRQGLLWDAVEWRGGQVSLGASLLRVFPKCWGPDPEAVSLKSVLLM